MSSTFRCRIATEMDAKRAVLEATQYARSAGFNEVSGRMIATAVSELTRNILKYADRGELILSEATSSARRGIRIVVQDQGPGIEDIDAALEDHSSSGGTLGLGLPGVRRLMDEFCLTSTPGQGTWVTAVKWL